MNGQLTFLVLKEKFGLFSSNSPVLKGNFELFLRATKNVISLRSAVVHSKKICSIIRGKETNCFSSFVDKRVFLGLQALV